MRRWSRPFRGLVTLQWKRRPYIQRQQGKVGKIFQQQVLSALLLFAPLTTSIQAMHTNAAEQQSVPEEASVLQNATSIREDKQSSSDSPSISVIPKTIFGRSLCPSHDKEDMRKIIDAAVRHQYQSPYWITEQQCVSMGTSLVIDANERGVEISQSSFFAKGKKKCQRYFNVEETVAGGSMFTEKSCVPYECWIDDARCKGPTNLMLQLRTRAQKMGFQSPCWYTKSMWEGRLKTAEGKEAKVEEQLFNVAENIKDKNGVPLGMLANSDQLLLPLSVFNKPFPFVDQRLCPDQRRILSMRHTDPALSKYWLTLPEARAQGLSLKCDQSEIPFVSLVKDKKVAPHFNAKYLSLPSSSKYEHDEMDLHNVDKIWSTIFTSYCPSIEASSEGWKGEGSLDLLKLRRFAQIHHYDSQEWVWEADVPSEILAQNPDLVGVEMQSSKLYNGDALLHIHQTYLNVWGMPFVGTVAEDMKKLARAERFTSCYWLSKSQAESLGMTIRRDAIPVTAEMGSPSASMHIVPMTVAVPYFNADQTSSPSSFSSSTCVVYEAHCLNGSLTGNSGGTLGLRKAAQERNYFSNFWIFEEELSLFCATVKPNAQGAKLCCPMAVPALVFNIEETTVFDELREASDPQEAWNSLLENINAKYPQPLDIFGRPFEDLPTAAKLRVAQAEKETNCPYWIDEMQAQVLHMQPQSDAIPISMGTNIQLRLYNGSEMSCPEYFNAENCIVPDFKLLRSGSEQLPEKLLLLMLREYRLHSYTSNIWLTIEELTKLGGKLKPRESSNILYFETFLYNLCQTTGVDASQDVDAMKYKTGQTQYFDVNKQRRYTREERQKYWESKQETPINVFGQPFPPKAAWKLQKAARVSNFTSPIWLTKKEASAMNNDVLSDSQIVFPERDSKLGYFNAEQTICPQAIDKEKCYEYTPKMVGLFLEPKMNDCLKFRTYAQEEGLKSDLWLTLEEIDILHGELLDQRAIGVERRTKAGKEIYFNVDQTTLDKTLTLQQARGKIPLVPRNVFGTQYVQEVASLLQDHQIQHGFSSPFWISQNHLNALGIGVQDDAIAVEVKGKTEIYLVYNSSQTLNPDLFAPLFCQWVPMLRLKGRVITNAPTVLRLRQFAHGRGYTNPCWVDAKDIQQYNITLKADAKGAHLPVRNASQLPILYNAEETEDPEMVTELCSSSQGKR